VWSADSALAVSFPLAVYVLQLGLNGLWSVIFFGLRRPDWACIEIAALWLSILATIVLFHRVNALAAYLLIPYALWVSFAVVLNFRVSQLNPVNLLVDT